MPDQPKGKALFGWTYATGPIALARKGESVTINVHLGKRPGMGDPRRVTLLVAPERPEDWRHDRCPHFMVGDECCWCGWA